MEILVPIIVAIVFLLFTYDSYYRPKPKKEVPDLRLSEYAPDLSSVPDEYTRKLSEKKQREAEREQNYVESRQREREITDEIWARYDRELNEAKAKRWREGNPVTRENPLKDYEQPRPPFNGHIF